MRGIINVFWNAEENRFRTGFRLIGFFIVFSLFMPVRRYLLQPLRSELLYGDIVYTIIFLCLFLLIIWIVAKYIDKRSLSSIGYNIDKEWWINFIFGLFLGAIILSLVFLIEAAFGWIEVTGIFYVASDTNYSVEMIAGFLMYILVSVREETISRGYLIKNFSEAFNRKKANPFVVILLVSIVTSILFGLGHANNQNATVISTWNIMVIGMILAYAYIASGSLAMPLGMHLTWNFFQGYIYGFPVSGHPVKATLFQVKQLGDDLWTGGSFGPEGGLVIYIAATIGFLMIYVWLKVRKGGAAPHIEIAEYRQKS